MIYSLLFYLKFCTQYYPNIINLRRKITTVSKPSLSLFSCDRLETCINKILFREMAVREAMMISTEMFFKYKYGGDSGE